MRNILNKIYIHPIFITTLLIFISIGEFRFIIYFMLLILVHELGHIFVSLLFKWNIEKIIILPFGGLTKYNEIINRPLIEEFLVAISGIIFQLMFYNLTKGYIDYKYFGIVNYFIILFNLTPIYPLDGSKILNVSFNIITSFKKSLNLTITISYIFIIIFSLLFFKINKIISFILIFLMIEVNKLKKEKNNIFNKFLLERYLKEFKFRKRKTINSIDKMKKDYKHLFYIDGKYLTESYFLKKMFDISKNL